MNAAKTVVLLIVLVSMYSCASLDSAFDSPVVDGRVVIFRYYDPSARTVQVGGDWIGNNWLEGDEGRGEVLVGLMHKDRGVWTLKLKLEPGRYRYRYLVNESIWVLDPLNPRVVDDGSGGKANLLIIP